VARFILLFFFNFFVDSAMARCSYCDSMLYFCYCFGGYDMFLAHGYFSFFTFSAPFCSPVGGLCSANRSVFEASDPHEFEEKSGGN
jgi:hypothetical protein